MTVSTPILMRPVVATILLRNGEQAITIGAGGHRVIVRRTHADALLDDLEDALDRMGDQ